MRAWDDSLRSGASGGAVRCECPPHRRSENSATAAYVAPPPPSTCAADSVNSSAAAEMHEGLDVFEKHAIADTKKYATD